LPQRASGALTLLVRLYTGSFAKSERSQSALTDLIRVSFTIGRYVDYPFCNNVLENFGLFPIVHGLARFAIRRRHRCRRLGVERADDLHAPSNQDQRPVRSARALLTLISPTPHWRGAGPSLRRGGVLSTHPRGSNCIGPCKQRQRCCLAMQRTLRRCTKKKPLGECLEAASACRDWAMLRLVVGPPLRYLAGNGPIV
jgi:hypothetical protein